jgi:hypothetical protein
LFLSYGCCVFKEGLICLAVSIIYIFSCYFLGYYSSVVQT